MNVYNAIMLAAGHIGGHPQDFDFMSCEVPKGKSCGTPGCAVGWINFFHGVHSNFKSTFGRHGGWLIDLSPKEFVHQETFDFYIAMDEIYGGHGWKSDPAACARALRLYAEKYYTPAKALRTDSELVADLLKKISGERIPEEA